MSAAEPLEVPSLQKRLDKATILGGAAATIMALLAGLLTRDTDWSLPSWLLVVSGVLLLWYVVTLLGRLTLVRAKDSTMPTPPIFFRWLGARFAIFFAMPILLFCWLASLPLGTPCRVLRAERCSYCWD